MRKKLPAGETESVGGMGLLTVIYNASRGLVTASPGVTQIILKCFRT